MAISTLMGNPIPVGKTVTLIKEVTTQPDNTIRDFTTDADSVLISLFVTSLTGTLDVTLKTFTEDGKEVTVMTFPTISSASTELLIRKAAAIMSNLRIEAVYTGICTYEIRARGISAGETSVRILGAASLRSSEETVNAVATQIVPASLTDRYGILLRNWTTGTVLYVGFSAAEATLANGYPISFREQAAFDINAGEEIWGISDSGPIDVRIVEAGQ